MIPIARPWLGEAELEAIRRPIAAAWVTQGPEVEAFEREVAEAVGAKYACAVANGTVALEMALRAVGVQQGDEVVTVSYSFIATANVIRQLDAIPRFVDIERETFNVDPTRVESALSAETKAILCVHQLGMPCDVDRLARLAEDRGVALIEDAACALGSEILVGAEWQRIGRPRGDVACFSFHPRKIVTTGEGGMITTADPAIDAKIRARRQHGLVADGSYASVGTNARMSDVHAAIGRAQLCRLDEMIARRRELACRYVEALSDLDDVTLPTEPSWARSNWQSFALRLAPLIDREALRRELAEIGVATLGGIRCAHRTPAYASEPWRCVGNRNICSCSRGHCASLVKSEEIEDRTLMLPLYHELHRAEQDQVVRALRQAIERSKKR